MSGPGLVLCVGEPLISLTPPAAGLALTDTVHLGVGGAELNVAVHLARLGVPVAYAGAVGRDPFGDRIRAVLGDAGVDCGELREIDGPTAVYFKEPGPPARMLYYRDRSAGSGLPMVGREVLARAGVVHVTGVGFALRGEIAQTVRALCTRPRSWRLSFDVNHRPALWSAADAGPALLVAARSADVVLVGRDEAEAVWGTADSSAILALLDPATELVVKDGADAVEVWADGRWWRSAPPRTEVVEPVGAGDAFAAAYLAARLSGRDPVVAAEQGHRLAAHVMASPSDQGVDGAPVYADLAARLTPSVMMGE